MNLHRCLHTCNQQTASLNLYCCINLFRCLGSQSVSSKCQQLHISSWCLSLPSPTPCLPECCITSQLPTSVCCNIYLFFFLVLIAVESGNKKETKGGKATKGKADQSTTIKAVSLQINLVLTDTDGIITLPSVSTGSNLSCSHVWFNCGLSINYIIYFHKDAVCSFQASSRCHPFVFLYLPSYLMFSAATVNIVV